MPELITGITYEQKVVTVTNDDTSMNGEITTQAVDDWVLQNLVVSGTDVILVFSRQVEIVLP